MTIEMGYVQAWDHAYHFVGNEREYMTADARLDIASIDNMQSPGGLYSGGRAANEYPAWGLKHGAIITMGAE